MSHDEHGHEKAPIILTSGKRMAKGLAIVVITLAIGAGIAIPFFDEFFAIPPPVTQIRQPPPLGEEPQTGGPTVIQIPSGAAVQGNPAYAPANANVPVEGPGSEIVWDNLDSAPHTATSGTGPDDPESGALFDTSIINPNEKSDNIVLEGVAEGDIIDYYCTLHPYMTAQLTIVAEGEGAQAGEPAAGGTGEGAAAGATISILEGSSVQGNPAYDPTELTARVGDKITVVNNDNVPHTVTSGTGSDDPNKGQAFDTDIMTAGQTVKISLAEVDPGTYDYFCIVHPYMTGKITVE
jgi:plastocyanin